MKDTTKTQKFQRIRLQRISMASGTYAFVLIIGYLIQLVDMGYIPPSLWTTMIFSALIGNGFFAGLVITGKNLSFSDPSMTRPQIIYSAIWGMQGVLALPEARSLVLMLFLASFMFGAMRLERQKYLELVIALSSILGAGLFIEYHYIRPEMNLLYEIVVFTCFTLTLLWFAFFGSYIYNTKRKLRDSKSKMELMQYKLQESSEKLQRAADTDYLTGVLNRRAFYKNIATLDNDTQSNYIVILQDIDHFKAINDEYGHAIGDAVLLEAVGRIRKLLRPSDILARWGGEEFLVLLNQMELPEAHKIAERIRVSFEQLPVSIRGHQIPLTISQGLVKVNSLETLDAAIKQADDLLYLAKRRGRNRLELAEVN